MDENKIAKYGSLNNPLDNSSYILRLFIILFVKNFVISLLPLPKIYKYLPKGS